MKILRNGSYKETQSILENAFPTYPYFGHFSVFHDMSQDGHISTLKVLSCVQELFDETSESLYLQHTLIEGHAGIGKTMLCKEICYQWAENNLFTPDHLVLLLLLQDPNIQTITSELQLAKYFGMHSNCLELFVQYLENDSGANVVIIIDGYDQLNDKLPCDCFFKDLIERKRLSKAHLVVTSTPSAAHDLYNCISKKVELFELTESAKSEILSAALNNHPNELKLLRGHLQQHCNMEILACMPAYLSVMVWLCLHKSLPSSITEMIEAFILHALNHHLKVTGVISDFLKIEQLMNFTDLNKLERFAFESLITGKSTFSEADTFTNVDDPKCYGLMQTTECYNMSSHSGQNMILKFYPGIQEYLAAKIPDWLAY